MRISYLFLAACLTACSSCEDKNAHGSTSASGTTGAGANSVPGCPPARTPDDWHTVDSLFLAMGGVSYWSLMRIQAEANDVLTRLRTGKILGAAVLKPWG